ncbi:MAG TPA: AmmeMemoRadiSam system protein A [Anaerolineae bacterium]
MELSEQQRNTLLDLAYQTIVQYLKTQDIPAAHPSDPQLAQPAGAFVTLSRHGDLRGCVGHIVANMPLYQVVQQMAVSAAEYDMRFAPITLADMDDIEIEISVLSPLERVDNVEQIEIGQHGLLITKGGHRGLLLPQVASERGWSREVFLEALCDKADLPPGSWKHDATLQRFTALIFEKRFKLKAQVTE